MKVQGANAFLRQAYRARSSRVYFAGLWGLAYRRTVFGALYAILAVVRAWHSLVACVFRAITCSWFNCTPRA